MNDRQTTVVSVFNGRSEHLEVQGKEISPLRVSLRNRKALKKIYQARWWAGLNLFQHKSEDGKELYSAD